MTEAEQPDRERWERECLHRLETRLENFRGTTEDLDVDDVHLEGTFPNTRVVATYTPRGGEKQTNAYELWGGGFQGPDGGRTTPGDAAVMIHVWLGGG